MLTYTVVSVGTLCKPPHIMVMDRWWRFCWKLVRTYISGDIRRMQCTPRLKGVTTTYWVYYIIEALTLQLRGK